jgi:SAM-dependent methyltransferase
MKRVALIPLTVCLTGLLTIFSLVTAAAQATNQVPTNPAPPIPKPDVIYVPTPQTVVDKMLEMAALKPGDLVYDLGCGDGRIVVTAARKYGVKAVGFDIDPARVKESRENARTNGVESLVTIREVDIFTLDLSQASVITLYLLPSLNVRLMPQLEKMKPGSRILSHNFAMRGARPEQVVRLIAEDARHFAGEHTIYQWTIPLKKEAPAPAGAPPVPESP